MSKALEIVTGKKPEELPKEMRGAFGNNRGEKKITSREKWLKQLKKYHEKDSN